MNGALDMLEKNNTWYVTQPCGEFIRGWMVGFAWNHKSIETV